MVPPPGWAAGLAGEFAIDRAALKFNARVQRVDQLQRKHTAVASQRFWAEYEAWMAAAGVKRMKGGKLNPVLNGREVELDRLHALVQRRGGYEAVTEERGWREVANALDVRRTLLSGWLAGLVAMVGGRGGGHGARTCICQGLANEHAAGALEASGAAGRSSCALATLMSL